MDVLEEIIEVVIVLVGLGLLLFLIPVLWMFIFGLANSIDADMTRDDD